MRDASAALTSVLRRDRGFSASELAFGVLTSWLASLVFWTILTPFLMGFFDGSDGGTGGAGGSGWLAAWGVVLLYDTKFALPIIVVVGIPLALLIESRMPSEASAAIVYGFYLAAGAAVAALLFAVFAGAAFGTAVFGWFAALAMLCAVAGRWGAGFWRERRRRRAAWAAVGSDG